jgi:hypothetical protein
MNDLELMLVTIGDLEFTRRKLQNQIQELVSAAEERATDSPEDPKSGSQSAC